MSIVDNSRIRDLQAIFIAVLMAVDMISLGTPDHVNHDLGVQE